MLSVREVMTKATSVRHDYESLEMMNKKEDKRAETDSNSERKDSTSLVRATTKSEEAWTNSPLSNKGTNRREPQPSQECGIESYKDGQREQR